MDKRTLLALFLVIILFMILQNYVFRPRQAPAAQEQPPTAQTARPEAAAAPESLSLQTAVADTLFLPAESVETIRLSNQDNFTVSFSTLGATITSIEMKKYTWADKVKPVDLVPEGGALGGMKLIGTVAETDLGRVNFQHRVVPDSNYVEFFLGEASAPVIVKRYTLDDKFGIVMDVTVNHPQPLNGLAYDFSDGIADSEKATKFKQNEHKFILYSEHDATRHSLAKMKKSLPGGEVRLFGWAALRTKYFSIAIAERAENPQIRNFQTSINEKTGNPAVVLDTWGKIPSQQWSQSLLIYAGPADYEILQSYGLKRMELMAERGAAWLRWLANIIAWFLKFLHRYIPNFGVVIIIFSIILKIILHPLTHKSMDASLKMQRIQPQVQAIQQKYKNDAKTMQLELSKLYKETGASPFSGCLPLLLQMPILFSLYTVLRFTIDMRNAAFVGWLKDLSEPDPYLILPILMGVFMILQSLMMRPPAAALEQMDEKQKAMQQSTKMMTWVMPIMMFWIFKGLPSGLVLYYTVFNILSVAQQYYLQKHFKTKETK